MACSRAEQQAERSRILADEEVSRLRGQLVSLGSLHHADDSAHAQSGTPEYAAHHYGIDRLALVPHPNATDFSGTGCPADLIIWSCHIVDIQPQQSSCELMQQISAGICYLNE